MTKKKYNGQLLVANPSNPRDELSRSVILLVTHTDDKAIGLQINNPVVEPTLQNVAGDIGIYWEGADPLWYGGSHSNHKIHVVHSNDWAGLSTVKINDEISVTNDISVLAAMSRGEGPEYYRACAGYWLWEGGELDFQLDTKASVNPTHRWELAPATIETVFDGEGPEQWRNSLEISTRQQVSAWF